jgi:hypothetical protein
MGERPGDAGIDLGRVFEPDAADADCFGHRREIRVPELCAGVEKARGFLLELDKAERAVVEHDDFHRQAELHEAEKVAISMAKPPSPDSETTCRPGNAA